MFVNLQCMQCGKRFDCDAPSSRCAECFDKHFEFYSKHLIEIIRDYRELAYSDGYSSQMDKATEATYFINEYVNMLSRERPHFTQRADTLKKIWREG